jgi:hypothetical protein
MSRTLAMTCFAWLHVSKRIVTSPARLWDICCYAMGLSRLAIPELASRVADGRNTELFDDEEIRTSGAPYSGDLDDPNHRFAVGEGRDGNPG